MSRIVLPSKFTIIISIYLIMNLFTGQLNTVIAMDDRTSYNSFYQLSPQAQYQTSIPFISIDRSNVVIDGLIDVDEYSKSFLDNRTEIRVFWEHNSINLTIALVSPGTGWVAVGIGDGMANATMMMGGVDTGTPYAVDLYGTGGFSHATDVSQSGTDDILEFSATENDTNTIFEFKFPMNSTDVLDPTISVNSTINMFFAYATSSDSTVSPHDGGRSLIIPVFIGSESFVPIEKPVDQDLDIGEFDKSIPFNNDSQVVVDGTIGENEYAGSIVDSRTGMIIYWEHNRFNLSIALASPGTGWAAFGIGSQMLDSTMIMGGYKDGSAYAYDLIGLKDWTHAEDIEEQGSSNIIEFAASETTETTFEFILPFNSSDALDPVLEEGKIYNMFFGYQKSSDTITEIHTAHSAILKVFIRPPAIVVPIELELEPIAAVGYNEEFELKIKLTDGNKSLDNIPVIFYLDTVFGELVIDTGITDINGIANTSYSNKNLYDEHVFGIRTQEVISIENGTVKAYKSIDYKYTVVFLESPHEEEPNYMILSRYGIISAFWIMGVIIWSSFYISAFGIILIYSDRERKEDDDDDYYDDDSDEPVEEVEENENDSRSGDETPPEQGGQ